MKALIMHFCIHEYLYSQQKRVQYECLIPLPPPRIAMHNKKLI